MMFKQQLRVWQLPIDLKEVVGLGGFWERGSDKRGFKRQIIINPHDKPNDMFRLQRSK